MKSHLMRLMNKLQRIRTHYLPQHLHYSMDLVISWYQVLNNRSVEDKENEDLRISGERLGGRGFLVANCTNCVIDLDGSILALQLRNLKQCRIIAGPVTGATMAFGTLVSLMLDCSLCIYRFGGLQCSAGFRSGENPQFKGL